MYRLSLIVIGMMVFSNNAHACSPPYLQPPQEILPYLDKDSESVPEAVQDLKKEFKLDSDYLVQLSVYYCQAAMMGEGNSTKTKANGQIIDFIVEKWKSYPW